MQKISLLNQPTRPQLLELSQGANFAQTEFWQIKFGRSQHPGFLKQIQNVLNQKKYWFFCGRRFFHHSRTPMQNFVTKYPSIMVVPPKNRHNFGNFSVFRHQHHHNNKKIVFFFLDTKGIHFYTKFHQFGQKKFNHQLLNDKSVILRQL